MTNNNLGLTVIEHTALPADHLSHSMIPLAQGGTPADAPMALQDQREAVRAAPSNVEYADVLGYYYIPIGAVTDDLDRIFGPDNWGYVISRESIREDQTAKGDPKYRLVKEILLYVRWANGSVQTRSGYGIADFFPKNNRANEAASDSAALSEAIKSAARRLGKRFGMGLVDEIKHGLQDDLAVDNNRNILSEAIGNCLLEKEDGTDELLTQEALEALSQKHLGAPVDRLDNKGVSTLAQIIQALPTQSDLARLREQASRMNIENIGGQSYRALKRMVESRISTLV